MKNDILTRARALLEGITPEEILELRHKHAKWRSSKSSCDHTINRLLDALEAAEACVTSCANCKEETILDYINALARAEKAERQRDNLVSKLLHHNNLPCDDDGNCSMTDPEGCVNGHDGECWRLWAAQKDGGE